MPPPSYYFTLPFLLITVALYLFLDPVSNLRCFYSLIFTVPRPQPREHSWGDRVTLWNLALLHSPPGSFVSHDQVFAAQLSATLVSS